MNKRLPKYIFLGEQRSVNIHEGMRTQMPRLHPTLPFPQSTATATEPLGNGLLVPVTNTAIVTVSITAPITITVTVSLELFH